MCVPLFLSMCYHGNLVTNVAPVDVEQEKKKKTHDTDSLKTGYDSNFCLRNNSWKTVILFNKPGSSKNTQNLSEPIKQVNMS